ncbi:MAG TPA: GDSL-type esterase/lipase family protein [Myxococcota bacterium]|nr:GDSL-type esterase/lipase family protein [Myxococcota bacterium]
MTPGRARLASLGVLLCSVLACAALAECGLRLWYTGTLRGYSGEHTLRMPDETRGWVLAPDSTSFQRTRDYGVLVETSSQGLRDVEHPALPEPGRFRILVLGDSFMEAYQVPLEDSLPRRLEARLAERGAEVLNLGVGGYGTAQELLALEQGGLRYRPALVVLAFYAANDVQNNSRAIEAGLFGEDAATTFSRPYARAAGLDAPLEWTPPDRVRMQPLVRRWHERRSSATDALRRALQPAMLAHLLEQGWARIASGLADHETYDPELLFGRPFLTRLSPDAERLWDDAWLATRRLLLETDRVATAAGARFAVLLVPADFQVVPQAEAAVRAAYPDAPFDSLRVNRELEAFLAEHGIPFLDPTPEFRRVQAGGRPLFYALEDRHWNAAGHALAAELLAAFLVERGLVPDAAGAISRP